ncbi:MAG: aminodeoxychorismate lyase [Aquificae bacterium]|nr:aminodeoxychorismate lyase [Aquificota bacterium]
MNRTLQFGEGLFETVRWLGRSAKLPLHYERLRRSADELGLPCPSYEEFTKPIKKLKGPLAVKLVLTFRGSPLYWERPEGYELLLLTRPLPAVPLKAALCFSPYRRHSTDPLTRHKTTSYLFNALVKRHATSRGFYDALVLNEKGRLCESSSAALLLYKSGRFYAPPPEEGALPSTTLSFLERELSLVYEPLKPERLRSGALFLVNSLTGFLPVFRLEQQTLAPKPGLAAELNELLLKKELSLSPR